MQLLVLASAVQAQEAPQRVEVVATAPLPGLEVPKDRVPANVQTANAADLQGSHAIDLSAFLARRLGGVHLNEVQNNPFQPDLNFRGFTASPLLGSAQGLSVYVDGVRLNQPFGDVVSWDLIPKSAIASMVLMPGSNPLFGLNTLGGAVSVQTKTGLSHPGTTVQVLGGNHGRVALEFESGGGQQGGSSWFVTGQRFRETGWRQNSPSDVGQLFGKFGFQVGDTRAWLSAAAAENQLNGNGLQEQRLLAADRSSVYSQPDQTRNRAQLLNLSATRALSDAVSLSGNVYWRRIHTGTYNGDVNDDALDQAVYQPNAAERAALAQAGYSGFPASGESAANTPFPKWRCIAQALLVDEPAEKCNGLINQSATRQINQGFALQMHGQGKLADLSHQWLLGLALDSSRVQFSQSAELGYLTAIHGIVGVGAFGDGLTGGDVDGEPFDTRVNLSARTRTRSLYASEVLALNPRTHLSLAGRYNRTSVENRDAITPGGGAGSLDGDHRFSRFNPSLGITFAASPALTAYAGWNQGSRTPSAVELGCADPENPCKLPNAMAGDPPLRQVVTNTLEAGLRGGQAGTRWNLGLFRADNRDDILFVADNTSGFGYFKNFGRTRRQGLEAGFSTTLGKAQLGFNYTWLDATFRSPEVLGGAGNSSNDEAEEGLPGVEGHIEVLPGHRIPLVPRHQFKAFAEWPLAASLSLNLDVSAYSGAFARGNENNAHQPDGQYYLGAGRSAGFAVVNMGLEWRAMPGMTVFAQVNNLLDRRYHSAAQLGATAFDAQGNFQARPFAPNAEGERPLVQSTFYAPGAPRTYWVGLRWALGR